MSEMEHWNGTIKEIIIPNKFDTWEKQVKFLQEKGFKFEDLDLEDKYFYENGSDVVYCNKKWYEFITKEEVDPDGDICEAKKIANIISFQLRFYNGGTCFSEMLKEAMDKLEDKK